MPLNLLVAASIAAVAQAAVAPAAAARGHDGCTGFIDALPFEITQSGTWCLRSNLVFAGGTGATAITVSTADVTVDCNGHRLSGAAGATVPEFGISAYERANVTVRRCDVRNFQIALQVRGRNPVVEDNRIYGARSRGMYVAGSNGVVRRNIVLETGRDTQSIGWAMGISAFGEIDIVDNTVSGVYATNGSDERAWGIFTNWNTAATDTQSILGNRVRHVEADGSGYAVGIAMAGSGYAVIRDNIVVAPEAATGIECPYAIPTHLSGNIVLGSTWPYGICPDAHLDNTGKN